MSLDSAQRDHADAEKAYRDKRDYNAGCLGLAACAEYDRICEEQAKEIKELRGEIERLNPIVIAAIAWRQATRVGHAWDAKNHLLLAVRTYEEEGVNDDEP